MADALETFTDYFVRNYPGPDTIIGKPEWHAPKIFSAAAFAIKQAASPALRDVTAERNRQIEVEGWTPEHDDGHVLGELAAAAACFALYRSHVPPEELMGEGILERSWPWDGKWWKPKGRRRDLVRAVALLLAEIERIDRAEARRD